MPFSPLCLLCPVAAVVRAVALLPVDSVLEHPPVAHPGHPRVRDGGATADHHAPTTVPDEAAGALAHNLSTRKFYVYFFVGVILNFHFEAETWAKKEWLLIKFYIFATTKKSAKKSNYNSIFSKALFF